MIPHENDPEGLNSSGLQHEKRSGWMALGMMLAIAIVPASFAFAGHIAPSPAQRRAHYKALRAERLGARPSSELEATERGPASAADLLARASAVASRARRAPEKRAWALRNAAWQLWAEAVRVGRPAEVAEAHFRSAELRRTCGEDSEALRSFLSARAAFPNGPYASRATLAASALLRSSGHFDGSLVLLDGLAFEKEARTVSTSPPRRTKRPSRVRDRARYERARTLQQAGRFEAARTAFRQLAEEAEDPLLAISSFDGWSRVLVLESDLEGAAGVLEACREKFRRRSRERTETGERLRRALQNMICIPRLQQAVAARQTKTSSDFQRAQPRKDTRNDTVRGDF